MVGGMEKDNASSNLNFHNSVITDQNPFAPNPKINFGFKHPEKDLSSGANTS
jgi:hypothetical protein